MHIGWGEKFFLKPFLAAAQVCPSSTDQSSLATTEVALEQLLIRNNLITPNPLGGDYENPESKFRYRIGQASSFQIVVNCLSYRFCGPYEFYFLFGHGINTSPWDVKCISSACIFGSFVEQMLYQLPITYLLLIAALVTSFLPPKFYGLDVFSIGYCTTFVTMNYKGTDF